MLRSFAALAGLTLVVTGACAAPGESAARSEPEPPPATVGVANLPHARGRSFATLDAYLAHLEQLGAQDIPYYREVRPGVYELVAGRRPPGHVPKTFTRRELAEKFGFPE